MWRSNDAGATWTQIKPSLNAALIQSRPSIAVNTLPNGDTCMYVVEGNNGTNASHAYRDSVATGAPTFTQLELEHGHAGLRVLQPCTGQCWYDLFVHSPEGHPDVAYFMARTVR